MTAFGPEIHPTAFDHPGFRLSRLSESAISGGSSPSPVGPVLLNCFRSDEAEHQSQGFEKEDYPVRKKSTAALPLSAILLAACCFPASTEANWPQFRGADSRGVAGKGGPPDRWSATENVAWKCEIPGRGWSSPIVWKDRVFL